MSSDLPVSPPPIPPDSSGRRRDSRNKLRDDRFRQAAIAVFFEKGFRQARMSDVVARSKGSMATLYGLYGDKNGLAKAIMGDSIAEFIDSLQSLVESPQPPQVALLDATDRMIEENLTPARIVCHRIAIGEGLANPELRDWFFEHAVMPTRRTLGEYFRREHVAGRLVLPCHEGAARRFYTLVLGGSTIRTIAGISGPAHHQEERLWAREAASMFIDAALPRENA